MCNRNDILNILKLFKIYSKYKESEINYIEGVRFWPKFIIIDRATASAYILLQNLDEHITTTGIIFPDKMYFFEYDPSSDDFNLKDDDIFYDDLNLIITSLKCRVIESCL